MSPQDLITSSHAAAATIGAAVLHLAGALDVVWQFLGATSSFWFPAIAVSAGTIMPEVGMADLGTRLLIAAALLYVAILASRFIDRAAAFIKEKT